MSNYKTFIGIEMHCEMKSNSKVFSSGRNSFNDLPNDNINPTDMAFPGTLPVVNIECVKKSLMASLFLKCTQPEYMYFDRKNYYYPDLPKGYQITQMHSPVGINGKIIISVDGIDKEVLIHDIHLEEDTARLDHYDNKTLIDYNRAGVPLLELVTEPCFNSSKEVMAFLEYIRLCYQYCDISDADSMKGQIRCDVNVSISDNDNLGTKVEIKGVSYASITDAIEAEVKRQTELKDNGKYNEVVQETRRFDEDKKITIRMRSKEDAIDYKYFVEPNIPKYKISEEWINEIRKSIPMLPKERKDIYINEYGLKEYDVNLIVKNRKYADYFEECIKLGIDAKVSANWLTGQIMAYINKNLISIEEFYLTPSLLNQILKELDKGNISSKQAKEIFNKSLEELKEPKNYISKENNQISDSSLLEEIIDKVLNNNLSQIEEYKNGRSNLFDYFVGQVMKETRGKANPVIVKEILKDKLDN